MYLSKGLGNSFEGFLTHVEISTRSYFAQNENRYYLCQGKPLCEIIRTNQKPILEYFMIFMVCHTTFRQLSTDRSTTRRPLRTSLIHAKHRLVSPLGRTAITMRGSLRVPQQSQFKLVPNSKMLHQKKYHFPSSIANLVQMKSDYYVPNLVKLEIQELNAKSFQRRLHPLGAYPLQGGQVEPGAFSWAVPAFHLIGTP